MKKISYAVFLIFIVFLAACSSNDKNNNASEAGEAQEQEKESGGISVDKGIFNVELTLPADLFGEDIDTTIAEAKEKGINVTKNDDGTLTYKMSKAQHKELMEELKTSMIEMMEDLKNGETFKSIKEVAYNENFSDFTLFVNKTEYENSFDAFAVLGLGVSGCIYQLFNGADPDNYNVKITVKDEATHEIIGEVNYPEDLKETGE